MENNNIELRATSGRAKGTAAFAVNFEPGGQTPLDARLLVSTKDDLINPETYSANNFYKGMAVTVQEDGTEYVLIDPDKITEADFSGWKQRDSMDTSGSLPETIITDLKEVTTTDNSVLLTGTKVTKTGRTYSEGIDDTVTIPEATTTEAGVMSAADKVKLSTTIDSYTINEKAISTNPVLGGGDIKVTGYSRSEETNENLYIGEEDTVNTSLGKLEKAILDNETVIAAAFTKVNGSLGFTENAEYSPSSPELSGMNVTEAIDENRASLNSHSGNTNNPHKVTKDQVGLGNVTNDAQVKRAEMGVAGGVATLGDDGKVPADQLPSFVDDVIDVYATYNEDNLGNLSDIKIYSNQDHTSQVTGEAGKIYVDIDPSHGPYQFRWSGTQFVQITSGGVVIGDITGTAFDGGRGKAVEDKVTAHISSLAGDTVNVIVPSTFKITRGSNYNRVLATITRYSFEENGNISTSSIPGTELFNLSIAGGDTAGLMTSGQSQLVNGLPTKIISDISTPEVTSTTITIPSKYKQISSTNINNEQDFSIILNSATSSTAGLMSGADKGKLDKVKTDGDGTNFLSDDGTYKECVQRNEFDTKINQLGSTITNEVSELEKADASINTQIQTINENIDNLGSKYLPLSGGTITGKLNIINTNASDYGILTVNSRNQGQFQIKYDSNNHVDFSSDGAGRLYIESVKNNVRSGKGLIIDTNGVYRSTSGNNTPTMFDSRKLIYDEGNLDISTFVLKTTTVNAKPLSGNITLGGADIALTGYVISDQINEALEPEDGDSVNVAIGKLHKAILDNEEVDAAAINKLNTSCGFNTSGEFVPSGIIIDGAPTISSALSLLDIAACKTFQKVTAGGTTVSASSSNNTLTLTEGNGIDLTGSTSNNSVTIALQDTISVTRVNASSGFYQTSDERLKTEKKPLEHTLDDICSIPTERFDIMGEHQIGTYAQKLEDKFPELVKETEIVADSVDNPNDFERIERGGETYVLVKEVDYSRLSILAIEGIKLLREEIEELKKKLEEK